MSRCQTRQFRRQSPLPAVLALAAGLVLGSQPAFAEEPLSVRNSFRIGSAGVACSALNTPADSRLENMFDRAYRLTCRDAAGAIGSLIAVRRDLPASGLPDVVLGARITCAAPTADEVEKVGGVSVLVCRDERNHVDYRRYIARRGAVTYLVEGLAGYDPVLRLALASVVTDRPVTGEVRVAITEVSDTAAFARVQAGQLNAGDARNEAYSRNNGAQFAESAEFFETIAERDGTASSNRAEALANAGLQQSNLMNFAVAERLFRQSNAAVPQSDGVVQRMLRNFRTINKLNQQHPEAALQELKVPVAPVSAGIDSASLSQGVIDSLLSQQINRENSLLQRLSGLDGGLTPSERAEILDAQADALAATAARQLGNLDAALRQFSAAGRRLEAVRDGRITSTRWLRSEIEIEQALIAESQGRQAEASAAFDRAILVTADAFPQSPALLAAQARKAAFLARTGNGDAARSLFTQVIANSPLVPDSGSTLRELLGPYFALLAATPAESNAGAMFLAAQVLQRPGLAQTQAILSRELSEGEDEASSLFRLSLARSREIARTEADINTLSALPQPSPQDVQNLAIARQSLTSLRSDQTALLSKLADYPRYKVLAPQAVSLDELQGALKDGEAYFKMMAVGRELYALMAGKGYATAWKIPGTTDDLASEVAALRSSIVDNSTGQTQVFPFDVAAARALYLKLFAPVADRIDKVKHLIVEPDAAMLQLPPAVLVTDQRGVDAYAQRIRRPDADEFDFTGVEWLGRGRKISVAVSPRGFLESRKLAPSKAPRDYLGLGQNALPSESPPQRPIAAVADQCQWPIATWQNPISSDELVFAKSLLLADASDVRTGAAFTDTGLLADASLSQDRVLHFATHGLVTPPGTECPAQPALVTSFGADGSDGLLSFREIFDLKLNADLVILSACDTASAASAEANRASGVIGGGGSALDGLVRAFVGAGARSVVASHWSVPDDYDATKHLIQGMIDGKPGQPLGDSLALAQQRLMDAPLTSHPFYWAAFIILGDGDKPMSFRHKAAGLRAKP